MTLFTAISKYILLAGGHKNRVVVKVIEIGNIENNYNLEELFCVTLVNNS